VLDKRAQHIEFHGRHAGKGLLHHEEVNQVAYGHDQRRGHRRGRIAARARKRCTIRSHRRLRVTLESVVLSAKSRTLRTLLGRFRIANTLSDGLRDTLDVGWVHVAGKLAEVFSLGRHRAQDERRA
jgi:hypothetical protein